MKPLGPRLNRRDFLVATTATGLLAGTGLLTGCGSSSNVEPEAPDMTKMYALSGKGRRVSNAALAHNANKRFATPQAAENGRAHPGDTSKVVPLDTSPATWLAWFGNGAQCVDLRKIL